MPIGNFPNNQVGSSGSSFLRARSAGENAGPSIRAPALDVSLTLVLLLSIAAALDGGRLLAWDPPLTDAFIGLRSPAVNRGALWISRLGSTPVVIAAGGAGVALAARRCRSVGLVMLVTVAARPPFEWLLKEAIERPRPSGASPRGGYGIRVPQRPRPGRRCDLGLRADDRWLVRQAPMGVVGTHGSGVERYRTDRLEPGMAGRALGVRRHRQPRHRLHRPPPSRDSARSPAPSTPGARPALVDDTTDRRHGDEPSLRAPASVRSRPERIISVINDLI
jgi:hypothetical protein